MNHARMDTHTLKALCLLAAGVGASQSLHAQVRPDAGQMLGSVRPAPPLQRDDSAASLPVQEERRALTAPGDLQLAQYF